MRSMLVIGLGRFGTHLATKLAELGNEVMVVDQDEETVNKIADLVTRAQIGDCMDIEVLSSLDVSSFDVCFVCISENFQSSLEITSLLKELGAPCVVSKSDRDIHAKFLLKIGADEVIYPERDMAYRAAARYSAKNAFDYIELSSEYAIFEILTPIDWLGRSIRDLDIRSRYNINIIGCKSGEKVVPITDAAHIFTQDEHLLISGSRKDLSRFLDTK